MPPARPRKQKRKTTTNTAFPVAGFGLRSWACLFPAAGFFYGQSFYGQIPAFAFYAHFLRRDFYGHLAGKDGNPAPADQ